MSTRNLIACDKLDTVMRISGSKSCVSVSKEACSSSRKTLHFEEGSGVRQKDFEMEVWVLFFWVG